MTLLQTPVVTYCPGTTLISDCETFFRIQIQPTKSLCFGLYVGSLSAGEKKHITKFAFDIVECTEAGYNLAGTSNVHKVPSVSGPQLSIDRLTLGSSKNRSYSIYCDLRHTEPKGTLISLSPLDKPLIEFSYELKIILEKIYTLKQLSPERAKDWVNALEVPDDLIKVHSWTEEEIIKIKEVDPDVNFIYNDN